MLRRTAALLVLAAGRCAAALSGQVTTLAGACDKTDVSLDCVGSFRDGIDARFSAPYGVAAAGERLLVADQDNNRLRVLDLRDDVVSTLSGNGKAAWSDGAGHDASFSHCTGVTVRGGFAFVADMDNHAIRRVSLSNGDTATLAGGESGYADGLAEKARFYLPASVAASDTAVFVADYANQRIRRVDALSGAVTTLAGACGDGKEGSCRGGFADGFGTSALFSLPSAVALSTDAALLYVAEERGNRVRVVRVSDGRVSTLAGSGEPGLADGLGTAALFSSPTGLAVAADGTVFVADALNMRIRSIAPGGNVSTLAGGGEGRFADGAGAAAAFWLPTGLALSDDGVSLYVADSGNERIRRIQ